MTKRIRIAIAIGVIVVLGALGGGLYWYFGPRDNGVEFSAMFSESIGIYPGSDVRILGVPVGSVDSVTPVGPAVRITMTLDKGYTATADTHAVIMSPSLVSDRYVQLTGVYPGKGPALREGQVIPITMTATPVEIDKLTGSLIRINQALGPNGANKNGAFSDLLKVGAENLKGNGQALHDMLNQLGKASGTLSTTRSDLFRSIDDLSQFTTMLGRNDASVRGLNDSLASVSNVLATDRQTFTNALRELSSALTSVKGFIAKNQALIGSNVRKLSVITETLMKERNSLSQALQTAPLALQNVINSYDPNSGTIVGRADLNELSLWLSGDTTQTAGGSTGSDGSSGSGAPPSSGTGGSSSGGWSSGGSSSGGSSSGGSSSGGSSSGDTPPPLLLPGVGDVKVSGGSS